jgi:hypothetical protein
MSSSGYLHPLYAQSLAEFGEPIELPSSKGWILRRPIASTPFMDGIGPYPIFACEDWSSLKQDLDQLEDKLISIAMITDPFGDYTHVELQQTFKDLANPYKEHFVIDLQRNAQRALRIADVEIREEPRMLLDEWCSLYQQLIERHQIKGIARFSREAFARQLSIPGITAFRAITNGETVGMLLWYKQGDIGYYHLGAYSSLGYQQKVSFALFWSLIKYFADSGLKWLSLGAGAGLTNDGQDGLTRFKRGWSTGTRTAYFCGRIFDTEKYWELVEANGTPYTGFFPAYRAGKIEQSPTN